MWRNASASTVEYPTQRASLANNDGVGEEDPGGGGSSSVARCGWGSPSSLESPTSAQKRPPTKVFFSRLRFFPGRGRKTRFRKISLNSKKNRPKILDGFQIQKTSVTKYMKYKWYFRMKYYLSKRPACFALFPSSRVRNTPTA